MLKNPKFLNSMQKLKIITPRNLLDETDYSKKMRKWEKICKMENWKNMKINCKLKK